MKPAPRKCGLRLRSSVLSSRFQREALNELKFQWLRRARLDEAKGRQVQHPAAKERLQGCARTTLPESANPLSAITLHCIQHVYRGVRKLLFFCHIFTKMKSAENDVYVFLFPYHKKPHLYIFHPCSGVSRVCRN